MEVQSFAGNNLNRSVGEKKSPAFLPEILALESTKIVLVSTNKRGVKSILCRRITPPILEKISVHRLSTLLDYPSIEALIISRTSSSLETDFILLGQDPENHWIIAVNIQTLDSNLLHRLNSSSSSNSDLEAAELFFEIGRNLLVTMSGSELAVAGQALAMASWHDENHFCSKTGQQTESIETGLKRQSFLPSTNSTSTGITPTEQPLPLQRKVYPRIDPVAIALISSPDQNYFLLGNMTRSPSPHFFSCLSGFIEPCESIEEAVCREVYEEAGVLVDLTSIQIHRSQPWPIGRGGGCELMIGCSATALTMELDPHDDDVREVKWFSREEVREMVKWSSENPHVLLNPREMPAQPFIPGPYAIAHHLLKLAVQESGGKPKEGE
jgi:NAD+ diphosphatase